MLVLLKENVKDLGRVGDVVKVTEGYARNFLIPRKLVVAADANNLAQVAHQKKVLEKKRSAAKASAEEIAAKIAGTSITLSRKVAEKDHLFGSVAAQDIVEALAAQGIEIEKRAVQMEPIKNLGTYTVSIKVLTDVATSLKVTVTQEGA
jgi:large subunit ribosomal protein L9